VRLRRSIVWVLPAGSGREIVRPGIVGPIGDMPPAEAEERYYAVLEQSAMAD
jgi:hypothetical protein